MKVIQIKLRTPGIFLGEPDPEQNIKKPKLVLKVEDPSGSNNWKPVEEVSGITVLADGYLPSSSVTGFVTQSQIVTGDTKVPLQGEGEKIYNLLVEDGCTFPWRIEATPCVDCVKVFRTYNRVDDIIDGTSVIVGKGEIKS